MFGALGYFVQLFLAHHVDGGLDQIAHHGFHVPAHIAHFGVFGGLNFDERAASQPREAPGDFGLADSGRANHQNILRQDVFRHFGCQFLAAHAIAQRDGDRALSRGLADDVLVQLDDNFARSKLVKRRLNRDFRFVMIPGKIDHHNLRTAFQSFVAPASRQRLSKPT